MKQCAICGELLDQHALQCSQGHSVFAASRHAQISDYLSDVQGIPYEGAMDDPVKEFTSITHSCPHCGNRASQGRSLSWIATECNERGEAVFPCPHCRQSIRVPARIFGNGVLERVRSTYQPQHVLETMPARELLSSNWVEYLKKANQIAEPFRSAQEWDGQGECPGCGYQQAMSLSQQFTCAHCQTQFWVNWEDVSQSDNSYVQCPNCNKLAIIPPSVWCPVCERNWRSTDQISLLIDEANHKHTAGPTHDSATGQRPVDQVPENPPVHLSRLNITCDSQGLTYHNTRLAWNDIVGFTAIYDNATTLSILDQRGEIIHIREKSLLKRVMGAVDSAHSQLEELYLILLERSGRGIYSSFLNILAAGNQIKIGNIAIDSDGIWEGKLAIAQKSL